MVMQSSLNYNTCQAVNKTRQKDHSFLSLSKDAGYAFILNFAFQRF